jgi:4-hydroxy-4-methyl-2-oxoglutarate aldolase
VGDILDTLGREHQFLPAAIQPLQPEMVVVGRAMPVLTMDVFGPQAEPFGVMTNALDALQAGEVWISGGASHRSATWGEIMTATARTRGAAGAVVWGYHRDTRQVLSQSFPVFSTGPWAQDSGPRMKVAAYRVAIEIEGVRVEPGDIVFGDRDGVVIVPRVVENEVFRGAFEKAAAENVVRRAIEAGLSSTEAFARYGVL